MIKKEITSIIVILLIAVGFSGYSQSKVQEEKIVNVADFGAIPNDGIDDQEAIQKAIDECANNEASILVMPAGVYNIIDEYAIKFMNDVMDFNMGTNPQNVVYTPYYKYARGIDFEGQKNVTVKAYGATLLCSGWMEPVSLENCENITIEGLTIDYKTIPHSEGKVVKVSKRYFEVELTNNYWISDKMLITRIMFWNLTKNRLLGKSLYHPFKTRQINENTVRIYAKTTEDMLGTVALMDHMFHFRPAILLLEAKNTHLKQVTIHSQPGMGIVGHRSENILLEGLRIVPKAGMYQSTNTDATHFTSCTGKIRFDGCTFEGQGDDATNVHGYYHKITKDFGDNSYEMKLEDRWSTHACVLDYPDVGNTIELLNRNTLEVVDSLIVVKVDTFPKQWRSVVKFNKAIPKDIDDFYVIDVTRLPSLEFVNSYVGSHLARGVLVKTRNVLIENCTFREGTGTAIHIGAEGDWQEGPGSANVIVRNNRIQRTGRGDATNGGACGIAVNVKAKDRSVAGIHKHIIIQQNIIEGENSFTGISVKGADDVKILDNEISGCENKVVTEHSTNVEIR